jgi:hypothetical protein
MQKSSVRIIAMPVTPPMAMQRIIACGASRVGRGISSYWTDGDQQCLDVFTTRLLPKVTQKQLTVICATASKPISDNALWSKPRIQATPCGQPVRFENVVKTNSASVLGDVARTVAAVAMNAEIDQKTKGNQQKYYFGVIVQHAAYEHPHSTCPGCGSRKC